MNGATLHLTVRRDALEELMDRVVYEWDRTVVENREIEGPDAVVEIYFDHAGQAEEAVRTLAADIVRHYEIREFVQENWAESWKKHFKAMDIGERLRVVPPWMANTGASGRIEIVINPGLSFGTGNHFTTRFCLEQLDRLADRVRGATVLDIGTGSGILAIAAAKLGARSVLGVDFDPICVIQSAENAAVNGVAAATAFRSHDITTGWPDESFDIVCANIYSALLTEHAPTLLRIARHAVILSGLRREDVPAVEAAFVRLGACVEARGLDTEWGGLALHPVPKDLSS